MNNSRKTDGFDFQVVDGKQLTEQEIDVIAEIVANMIYENSMLTTQETDKNNNNSISKD